MSGLALDRWDGCEVDALREAWDVPVLEAYARIGSTNDRARELADASAATWSTVVADEQTRGRGRRGSTWISARAAGLWMSVILPTRARRGCTTLEVGLVCAEAIEEVAPGVDVGIKWPNDLLVSGAKIGGILCEAAGHGVVVGIGLNVAGAPSPSALDGLEGLPPGSLEVAAGKVLARNVLAGAIVKRLRRHVEDDRPDDALGEDALAHLRRRDVLDGRPVETEQAGSGRAAGIDASGALRLILADGAEVRVVSGSVRLSPGEGRDPS